MIVDIIEHEASKMGLALSSADIKAFEIFAMELIKWNTKINLTAITDENEIAIKHFVDSLHLAKFVYDDDLLLDIGSGAGFPIIALKIARPNTRMVSVDAVAKKINFQRHIIRTLNLEKIEAVHARIESLYKTHIKKYTLIISRAFARLDHFVSLAAPLLADNGRIIAMKGSGVDDEITVSDDTLKNLGLIISARHRYFLPNNMGIRVLTVVISANRS